MRAETSKQKADEASPAAESAPEGQVSRNDIERLFKEHNDALLCFIHSRLHSWSEAKDVAQEAYVKLLGLDEVRAVSYLQAYLYKVAGNLITDRMRKREVRTRHEHFVFFDIDDRERAVLSAEAESIQQQERECLERAVEELPERCRQAFRFVELEGKSVKFVADHLQIKPESVRQFIHRAYEYLGQALSEQLAQARRKQ
jgi:RNA polymerase sigma factor (sigma-70 family)